MEVYEPCSRELVELLKQLVCRQKYLIACIGSWLRTDDRAGLEVCSQVNIPDKLILCEYGLENCISDLIRSKAWNLLLIDAVVIDKAPPGSIVYADIGEVSDSFLATTHNIPVNTIVRYLRTFGIANNVKVLGIGVKSLDFGDTMTPEVTRSVICLSRILKDILAGCEYS